MQESGKAYLNGKPVDFSEFRVDRINLEYITYIRGLHSPY